MMMMMMMMISWLQAKASLTFAFIGTSMRALSIQSDPYQALQNPSDCIIRKVTQSVKCKESTKMLLCLRVWVPFLHNHRQHLDLVTLHRIGHMFICANKVCKKKSYIFWSILNLIQMSKLWKCERSMVEKMTKYWGLYLIFCLTKSPVW